MITSVSRELNSIEVPFFNGEVSMLPFDLSDLTTLPIEFRASCYRNFISDLEQVRNVPDVADN